MVYALHLEQIDAWVRTERQVTASMVAGGATGLTWPTYEQKRADFDAELVSESKVINQEKLELMRALGVA